MSEKKTENSKSFSPVSAFTQIFSDVLRVNGFETAKGGTLADSPFVKLKQPVPAAD
ncbi:hypothetical protein [Citrifermentans bemidjiense]|uniref:hypothetical protein n=1 Tax=Citrifermentans bemidjiense TaxID=225194 RepID=UPI00145E6ED3|nr:hypothetical protein [Citrifermentans bemidjiense]